MDPFYPSFDTPTEMEICRRVAASAILMLLAIALVCQKSQGAAAQAADAAAPQIDAIRVGLNNFYKVGHWTPVRVDVQDISSLKEPRIEITVPDNDGIATTAAAPVPLTSTPNAKSSAVVYTKVGRIGAPIRVRLLDGDQAVEETLLHAGDESTGASHLVELPATAELVVTFGSAQIGLRQAFADRAATAGDFARRFIELEDVTDLPKEWYGYDSVDVVLISASDITLCRQLAADQQRFAALAKWVELGGRLIFLCGGESARELLATGEPLASLLPGRFVDVIRLTETGTLEQFAEPAGAISSRAGTAISIPRLVDVHGAVEVSAGPRLTDPPLVVRSVRGFGQITFAGIDLSKPPLADWPDRYRFIQALVRPYVADGQTQDESQSLVARGYNDLSGALRQRLGRSFTSLVPISFPLVAVLAIIYLLVLGPLDYLLVQRWLQKPLAAWITFSAIVLLFGIGAAVLAKWREGTNVPRVNRLELIDVDLATQTARGTFWATLHSPQARQFDLSLQLDPLTDESTPRSKTLLSSWGLPGTGIGGMDTRAGDLGIVPNAYHYVSDGAELDDVPVVTMSSKSLTARWTAPVASLLEADLADENGLASGSIVNRSGHELRNVRLFYRNWGYRLGNLTDGKQIDVGERSEPPSAKTVLTASVQRAGAVLPGQAEGGVFVAERAFAAELLNLMMFYEATGGLKFSQLPNRYQADCDLSGLLSPGLDRAVLVAEVPDAGSRLTEQSSGEPLGNDSDFAAVVYRFVIPVTRNPNRVTATDWPLR